MSLETYNGQGIYPAPEDILIAEERALLRDRIRIGSHKDILSYQLDLRLSDHGNLVYPGQPLDNFLKTALAIRELAEPMWDERTSFPDDSAKAMAGEPLGQCMVTARLARNQFVGSTITEVNVKRVDGRIVGPHIVLEVETNEGKGYLDLTPDQTDALGPTPESLKIVLPYSKVRFVPLNHPEMPYEFVRYQTDEEMSQKTSRPLDHTRLLMAKVAVRSRQSFIYGPERFAEEVQREEFIARTKSPELKEQLQQLPDAKEGSWSYQFGIVSNRDYLPSPQWLWDVLGLSGHDRVYIHNKGRLQEMLEFDGDTIQIVNPTGRLSTSELDQIRSLLQRDNPRVQYINAPTLMEYYATHKYASSESFQREWDGPLFGRRVSVAY